MTNIADIIDDEQINSIIISTAAPDAETVDKILIQALKKKGLSLTEVGYLLNANEPKLIEKMFAAAAKIKQEIYGERLVFFAPLYVSNYCVNDCDYCGFHARNLLPRKKLSLAEVAEQVKILEAMGHKRLLLEFGEHPQENPIDYIVDVIKTIYQTKNGRGEIRRVNVNIAATTAENYHKLKDAGIGTYQLFQETYHQPTYDSIHCGPKADYSRQLFAHNLAFAGGIDDVGLGVLFGLYDYRYEVLGLVSHAQYLDKTFGVGPHTFSVPRFRPAETVNVNLPYQVSEDELLKIISILRLAVPYTGMIISTRENSNFRARAFTVGISQTSAASKTSPGGYGKKETLEQFNVFDQRSLDEVIKSVLMQDLLPSFCTACYRQGRTGHNFMDLAKPGDIHRLCRPNAILTFLEYLNDYASDETKTLGQPVIEKYLKKIEDASIYQEVLLRVNRINAGERDLYF